MTTSSILVGQTVVSDPGGSSSGGYMLLASSPSVRPEDADLLSLSPGASETLHTAESPGPYFSFFPLQSGAWAFVRRFVHGTRRGTFHRVVTHALVVTPAALAALSEQPWLLVAASHFRPLGAGDATWTLKDLERQVGDPGLRTLPDLECLGPADPRGASRRLVDERRELLISRWGAPALQERLAWLLSALAGGRRAVLPQTLEDEELLALAWSCLPPCDRLAAPWTTHFAPGVQALFRLVNAPDPAAVRSVHPVPGEWVAWADRQAAGPAARSPGVGFARLIVEGGGLLDRVLEISERESLSLLANGAALERRIVWEDGALRRRREGVASPREFAAFLREAIGQGAAGRADPWIQDRDLLEIAVATARRGAAQSGGDARGALDAVARVVADWQEETGARWAQLVLAALRGPAGDGEAEERLLWNVGLLTRLLLPPPGGLREREELASALAQRLEAPPAAERTLPIVEDLAMDLVQAGSRRGLELLAVVAPGPEGLLRALRAAGPSASLEGLCLLFETASPWKDEAARAVAWGLVRCLATQRVWPRELDRERVREVLRQAGAGAFAEAVRTWHGELRQEAVAALREDLSQGREGALKEAAGLAQALSSSLGSAPDLKGLAGDLRSAGAPARLWLSFACLELKRLEPGTPVAILVKAFVQGLLDSAGSGNGVLGGSALEALAWWWERGTGSSLAAALNRLEGLTPPLGATGRRVLDEAVRASLTQGAGGGMVRLLDLLASPAVLPTVRLFLERDVLARELDSSGEDLAAEWLADWERLAARTTVLWAVARWLGRRSGQRADLAEGFLQSALQRRRFDAVAELLQARSAAALLDRLPARSRKALRTALDSTGGWRLAAVAPWIRDLEEGGWRFR